MLKISNLSISRKSIITATLSCFIFSSITAQTVAIDSIAERMLVYQRSYGGWPKAVHEQKVDYNTSLTEQARKEIVQGSENDDATIDNKATSREIIYLVHAYATTKNETYLKAAKRGIDYLLEAQYDNGGWPQYYPNKKIYRAQITYNDDAMINVLNILQDVAELKGDYAVFGQEYTKKAQIAVDKGLKCILKTQVTLKGKLTVWAAQYDEKTLVPAKARAFELPSLSSSESANIVKFLMRQRNPSQEVIKAITNAVQWFDDAKITGFRIEQIDDPGQPKGKDRVLVPDASSVIWARFYDLDKMEPMFVGRDGIPKKTLAEIDNERRTGYAWYGTWGAKLPKEYDKWKKANNIK
jgi:PelA/Pel-15E family pectate lyase